MGLDIILSLKKYLQNIKVIFSISLLLIFVLFLINPLFSLFGGSLNISYNILNQDPFTLLLIMVAIAVFIVAFTFFQTIIVFRVENEYEFDKKQSKEIKEPFFELLKFNLVFYLLLFIIICFLYDVGLLENILINIVLLFVSVIFWFMPQIIIMEKEKTERALIINFNYLKKNAILLVYLFVTAFILTLITYFLDVIFGLLGGTIVSSLFFVLFVIPLIEILKTEVYLDKYKLLKPNW